MPSAPLDPSIIDAAPLTGHTDGQPNFERDAAELEAVLFQVQAKLEEQTAEVARLKGKKTVDDVKAEILEGYTKNVFRFVLGYCVVVAFFLGLAAWKSYTRFELSDTILSIIAGSTAVSVIGLIGMVITGLFGTSKISGGGDA